MELAHDREVQTDPRSQRFGVICFDIMDNKILERSYMLETVTLNNSLDGKVASAVIL